MMSAPLLCFDPLVIKYLISQPIQRDEFFFQNPSLEHGSRRGSVQPGISYSHNRYSESAKYTPYL